MDELSLYDQARDQLRRRLRGRFPSDFDVEATVTAYAYWVCTVARNRGKDWGATLEDYVCQALRQAVLESRAELVELDLVRRELRQAAGPLLDVGAGWGRFRVLYSDCGLQAVYTEPSYLGCQLLRRNGLASVVRCPGQSLSFPAQSFRSVVVGWVLHHDAPDVPATAILSEAARVTVPGGRLISLEPLFAGFDISKWRGLVETAGFVIRQIETFFDLAPDGAESEQYACLTADRHF